MDTDDLTPMAYDCIMAAYKPTDVLAIELGAAASNYSNEEKYLKGILDFVTEVQCHPIEYLESWNLEDIDPVLFKTKVNSLVKQIEKTIATPISDRGLLIDW